MHLKNNICKMATISLRPACVMMSRLFCPIYYLKLTGRGLCEIFTCCLSSDHENSKWEFLWLLDGICPGCEVSVYTHVREITPSVKTLVGPSPFHVSTAPAETGLFSSWDWSLPADDWFISEFAGRDVNNLNSSESVRDVGEDDAWFWRVSVVNIIYFIVVTMK